MANTNAYIGQIELFAFDFVPPGWMKCEGQLLPINQHQPLFALLGTTYGGDGSRDFALPDLRGRVPIGFDKNFPLGGRGGEEAHRLTEAEIAAHNHRLMADASTMDTGDMPSGVLGQTYGQLNRGPTLFKANLYSAASPDVRLDYNATQGTGQDTPHENRMPSRALNFCICVEGLFPPH
jgi:microcystin-dependent protein